MREIKFKAKRVGGGKWVVGCYEYIYYDNVHLIRVSKHGVSVAYEIDPNTLCQFTGLTDKNGKEVYEGDKIKTFYGEAVLMWFQTAWGIASYGNGFDGLNSYTSVDSFYINDTKEWLVIGNIHDK